LLVVDIPDRGDAYHEMWLELIRLSKEQPAPWTLIGAHMVALHGWMRGRAPIRPSKDADILVNLRVVSQGTAALSQALVRDGYELSERSIEGLGHSFARGDVRFDVLAPDGLGLGTVPLPDLLGAMLVKIRAIDVDDEPRAQRSDVAFLLSLVEDPDELAKKCSATERGWLGNIRTSVILLTHVGTGSWGLKTELSSIAAKSVSYGVVGTMKPNVFAGRLSFATCEPSARRTRS
jgi:hypothetical protein